MISQEDIAQWSAQVALEKEADKENPLYQAIIDGRPEEVRAALASGTCPNSPFKLTGFHPLKQVAGCPESVAKAAVLLEASANIDAVDSSLQTTPLMASIYAEDWPLAQFYIERGADVAKRDAIGSNALDIAASTVHEQNKEKYKSFVRLLLQQVYYSREDLQKACSHAIENNNGSIAKIIAEKAGSQSDRQPHHE